MRRGDYTLLLDWERRKKKNLMPSSRIVFEIADLTHYEKNCELCAATAILL